MKEPAHPVIKASAVQNMQKDKGQEKAPEHQGIKGSAGLRSGRGVGNPAFGKNIRVELRDQLIHNVVAYDRFIRRNHRFEERFCRFSIWEQRH